MRIQFYVAKETTEYESKGFMYKSADANFADTYCQTGGGYVRKMRWVECCPSEAEWISWESPDANFTRMIGDPEFRYQLSKAEPMPSEYRDWFISVSKEGRSKIAYSDLFVDPDLLLTAPVFIKQAILATEMEAHRQHKGNHEYLEQFHPLWVLELLQDVEPLYLEESVYLPDLGEKIFEKVEIDGEIGVKFLVPSGAHGAIDPENLNLLPPSVRVELGDYNSFTRQVVSVTYFGLITYQSAEYFHKLSCSHAHSLSNCGKGALMCSTLELIYQTIARNMFSALERAEKSKEKGNLSPEEYLAQFPDMRKD